MNKILVTGGAGYIGSHTCKELKKAGYETVVYDNLSTGSRDAVKWSKFEEGDIRDFDKLNEVMQKHNIESVIHFASLLAVGDSVVNPYEYYENNVFGSMILLNAMQENDIKNIVFSSTAAVYGVPEEKKPINENHPLKPINPYGKTKLMIEEMLEDFSYAYDMNFSALRYFNACGADSNLETGWYNKQPTNLIPVITKALAEKKSFNVFGNDYATPDGTCIRDYIHVTDLAKAHVKALEYIKDNKKNLIVNLGTAKGTSVMEMVKTTEEMLGKELDYKITDRREGDPDFIVADPSLAEKTLGWKAELGIKQMLDGALKWQDKYFTK